MIALTIINLSCQSNNGDSLGSESHGHSHDGHDHGAHDHPAPGPDEVEFSDEQAKLVNLIVKPADFTVYQHVIKVSGELLVPLGDETSIVAPSNGILNYTLNNLSNGSTISSGQTVAMISAKNLQDGDPLEKTRAEFNMARREFERAEQLIVDSLISQSSFEQAKLNFERARVSYQALAGDTRQGQVQVRSQSMGFVKNILVKNGEYVQVGQTVLVLAKNKRIHLKVDIPQKYAQAISQVKSANFKLPSQDKIFSLAELNGKVLHYGKSVEENSHYLYMVFEFNNQDDFLPGVFGEVFLIGKNLGEGVVVPRSALLEEQGLYSVYVKTGKHPIYKKKPVTVGMDNGISVQILAGLQPGERLVTNGAYYLKLASMNSAIPHGHAH